MIRKLILTKQAYQNISGIEDVTFGEDTDLTLGSDWVILNKFGRYLALPKEYVAAVVTVED